MPMGVTLKTFRMNFSKILLLPTFFAFLEPAYSHPFHYILEGTYSGKKGSIDVSEVSVNEDGAVKEFVVIGARPSGGASAALHRAFEDLDSGRHWFYCREISCKQSLGSITVYLTNDYKSIMISYGQESFMANFEDLAGVSNSRKCLPN